MLGLRERFVRDWPEPALRQGESDASFPRGWRTAAADGGQPSLVDGLSPAEREEFDALASAGHQLAAHLREREAAEGWPAELLAPQMLSASGLVDYGRCPKRFYWSYVRPLPRFSGVRARIGTDIHSWIERRASGQGTLIELDEPPRSEERRVGKECRL